MNDHPLIYLAAGDTARNPSRSGIQTTVRRLVAKLGQLYPGRARVAFWNRHARVLHPLPRQFSLGLAAEPLRRAPHLSFTQKLAAFPGWFPGRADDRIPLHRHPQHASSLSGAWLLLPELLYGDRRTERLIAYARRHGMKVAAIFHDAIPVQHPEFSRSSLTLQHRNYMRGLAKMDLIIPTSETSAEAWRDVLKQEGLPSPAVEIVPLAGEIAGAPRVLEPAGQRIGGLRVLSVSTVEPRKNHRTLFAALEQLAGSEGVLPFEVDLVGSPDPTAPELAALVTAAEERFAGLLRWHRRVDSGTLRQLYAQCDFTVYPSVVEGFGIPILESLWFARPCICANFGVMQEHAGGGGCLTVDVRDASALAAGLQRLMTEPELRHRLTREATLRPIRKWAEYATEIVQALDRH